MNEVSVNRLVPVKPDNRKMVVTAETPITEWPTSLEVGSYRWKACLVNAQMTPDFHLEVGESHDFVMVDWLIQWTTRRSKTTGEESQFSQLVLFDRDGNTLASSGEYVGGHLQKIMKVFTPEEFRKGIKVRLECRNSKNGRGYHQLKVVPEE